MVDAPRLLDQPALAGEVSSVGIDLERLAEDAQGAVIRVQGPVDHGREQALRVMTAEGLLDDALARAGLADDDAQPPLLAVYAQRVEDLLLHREQRRRVVAEWVALETEVGADHGRGSLGLRSL